MTQLEYKKISVSKAVYDRLIKDKDDLTKKIGINFSINSTINEYHKILDGLDK